MTLETDSLVRLDAYTVVERPPELRPGRPRRDWMDAHGHNGWANRCLPLAIANTSGWEVLCPVGFSVEWNGAPGTEDVIVTLDEPGWDYFAKSHFQFGTVTLDVGYLFRTDPGWALRVSSAPNSPKDGIQALDAMVETDWLPMAFTMNWRFTRPGVVRFEKGEPFCFIQPTPHLHLDAIQPKVMKLQDNPDLNAEYCAWAESRNDFIARRSSGDPAALKEEWQKFYHLGTTPTGFVAEGHVSRRRLRLPEVAG